MLNIISLQALRKKSTWPSKVAKNLIKGLDLIWEPYIINGDPKLYKNIYILDDESSFRNLENFPKDCEILAWPILNQKKNISNNIKNKYIFIYPSNWIKKLWDKYKWHKNSITRPVWIDTYSYTPSNQKKDRVLIYFKTRYPEELELCKQLLNKHNIKYNIINYDTWYKEKQFIEYLKHSKYVIWIWRQETQWIALEEILSMNVPILLWDVHKVWDWLPNTEYEKKCFSDEEFKESATAAAYFDETCWIRFYDKENLENNIEKMEKSWNKGFSPREYILNNLSLEKQAKEMISFYKDIKRWNDIKKKKYMRSNLLLKLWWKILDSKKFSKLYFPLVKLYFKLTVKNKVK